MFYTALKEPLPIHPCVKFITLSLIKPPLLDELIQARVSQIMVVLLDVKTYLLK